MKIGIPRALTFYRYYPFLKSFLEECGLEVLSSPPTDPRILEKGVEGSVDDVCVALKVFLGHIRFLEKEADALLIPRPVSVERRTYDTFTCPKIIAAPDVARFFSHRPPLLLEWVLDVRKAPWWWGCLLLALRLGITPGRARKAYRAACRAQHAFESLLYRGWLPDEALDMWENMEYDFSNGRPLACRRESLGYAAGGATVGLVGHPYLLADRLVNKDLVRWLEGAGAVVVPCTMLSPAELEREHGRLPDISWSYERELLAAASFFARRSKVHGVIYVTSFGCGPDSMAMEVAKREIMSPSGKPFLEMVLDEHTADSAVRTRAEAFVDMLQWRVAREVSGPRRGEGATGGSEPLPRRAPRFHQAPGRHRGIVKDPRAVGIGGWEEGSRGRHDAPPLER